ncbi:MAG: hypothetical protein K9W46_00475 [Candidatus Heimdallarchaeum endolithica]|uniref:MalT-like TPR region domain-containing protein n=1 Tax=Candidatus Heimdallarchaeum endolithica TaxID=2876572 RepID=A0A9Y1BR57_9ARCH|nr:MAG: hypothetical protein K9W46_00475 [Candidatus Heimdallarchaeum endolithica]
MPKKAEVNLQLGELFRFNYYFEDDRENVFFDHESPNLVDVVSLIVNNWSEIIESRLSPIYQSKIAYILKMYNFKEKLEQLYSQYMNIWVGTYYLGLLNTEMGCNDAKELIYFLDESFINNSEVSPFLYFDYIIEKIQFHLNCNQIEPIDSLLNKAGTIIKGLKDKYPERIIAYYNSILMYVKGKINNKKGKIIEAKNFFSQAITILKNEELEDQYILGCIFSELASIIFYFDLDNAEILYRKSFNIFELLKIEIRKNIEKANLAYIRFQKGYVDESLDILIETMYFFEKKYISQNLIRIYLYLSKIFLILNHFENSESYLKKSFKLANKFNFEVVQLYTVAFDYYLTIKNTEEANKYLILFKNFIEKILNLEENSGYVFEYKIRTAQIELLKENIWNAEKILLENYIEISTLKSSYCLLKRNSILIRVYLLKFRIYDEKNTIVNNIIHIFKESNNVLKRYFSLFQWINYTTQISQFFIILDFPDKANSFFYNIKESLAKFNISDSILLQIINNIEVELFANCNKKTSQITKLVNSYHYDLNHLVLTEIDFFEIIRTFTPLKENLLVLQIIDSTEEKVLLSYNFVEDNLFLSNELLGGMVSLIFKISKEIHVEKVNNNNNDCRFVFNSGFIATIFPLGNFSFSLISNFYTHDSKSRLINYAIDVYPILKEEGVTETIFKKIQEHF